MQKSCNRKSISIYDISKNIGIAPSTVSRVLNGNTNISESVTKEVIKVSRSLGFIPNKRVRTIGVIVGEMSRFDPVGYAGMLMVYLAKELKQLGLVMELIDEEDLDYVKLISYDALIGIIFNKESLIRLQEFNLPVITVNYPMSEYGFHSISIDHIKQMQVAVEYLFKMGHRKIAFLEGRSRNWGSRKRLEGFIKTHEQANIPVNEKLILYSTEKPLHEITEIIFRNEATAIINCSEENALELPYFLQRTLNKRIPDDISLITTEVNPVQKYMEPPLTVISQPFNKMCKLIVDRVQEIITGNLQEVTNIVLESELIERYSVKKI